MGPKGPSFQKQNITDQKDILAYRLWESLIKNKCEIFYSQEAYINILVNIFSNTNYTLNFGLVEKKLDEGE